MNSFVVTTCIMLCIIPVTEAKCYLDKCLQCTHGPCTRCSQGWYLKDCSRRCVRCQSDGCEQFTGRCIHCLPGFYGDSCDIPCPMNCLETYTGSLFCDRTTGRCLEGCGKSFWGGHCDTHCSKKCLHSDCQQQNGECLDGCIAGFYGIDCTKHCPENCLQACSSSYGNCDNCKHGFYGLKCYTSCEHCKDEECRYNELDETAVCVNGCKDGWTSDNCNVRCSERCRDQLCQRDGSCTACPSGYVGDDCTDVISNSITEYRGVNNLDDGDINKYDSHACRTNYHRWLGCLTGAMLLVHVVG